MREIERRIDLIDGRHLFDEGRVWIIAVLPQDSEFGAYAGTTGGPLQHWVLRGNRVGAKVFHFDRRDDATVNSGDAKDRLNRVGPTREGNSVVDRVASAGIFDPGG